MGKKPVVGLIGLLWAGIAVTGCGECCRNTRNTYNPKSTWETKDPAIKAPVAAPKGPGELTPAQPPVEPGPGAMSDARSKFGGAAAPKAQEALRMPAPREVGANDLPKAPAPSRFTSRETAGTPEPKREGLMPPPTPVRREPAADMAPSRPAEVHTQPLPPIEGGPTRAEPAPPLPGVGAMPPPPPLPGVK